jgi:L-fucose mutarotase
VALPWAPSNETNTMLKNLSPLHTPELLHALASMGHGDDLAIVDAHFPAVSMAKRLIRLDGVDGPAALNACLRLIPLDTFVDEPALRMEVVQDPDQIPEVQQQFQKVIDQEEGKHWPLGEDRAARFLRASEKGLRNRRDRRVAAVRLYFDQKGRRFERLTEGDACGQAESLCLRSICSRSDLSYRKDAQMGGNDPGNRF